MEVMQRENARLTQSDESKEEAEEEEQAEQEAQQPLPPAAAGAEAEDRVTVTDLWETDTHVHIFCPLCIVSGRQDPLVKICND